MKQRGFIIAVGIAAGAHAVAGSLFLPEALAKRKAPEVAISITDGTAYAEMVEKWNQTPEIAGDAAGLDTPQDFTGELPELSATDAADVARMEQDEITQEDRRKTFVPPEIIFNRVTVEPQVIEMASFSGDFGAGSGLATPSLGTPRSARPGLSRPGGSGLSRSPMAAPSAPRASAAHIRKDKEEETQVAEDAEEVITEKPIVVASATDDVPETVVAETTPDVFEEDAVTTVIIDGIIRPLPRPERVAPEPELALAEASGEDAASAIKAYLVELAQLIREQKVYPDESRARGEQGEAIIEIVLGPDGALIERSIARSSGFDALDEASLAAVAAAEPFPPFPADATEDAVTYSVPLNYFLN
ncbi:MAG: TonB family protein [Pseudomonadota bacterium]